MEIITGQVPVDPPECRDHREKAHDAEGTEAMRWCGRCGWNRTLGVAMAPPNGGWA